MAFVSFGNMDFIWFSLQLLCWLVVPLPPVLSTALHTRDTLPSLVSP
jgi:hypothetical protein